jgi:hypothetical protein
MWEGKRLTQRPGEFGQQSDGAKRLASLLAGRFAVRKSVVSIPSSCAGPADPRPGKRRASQGPVGARPCGCASRGRAFRRSPVHRADKRVAHPGYATQLSPTNAALPRRCHSPCDRHRTRSFVGRDGDDTRRLNRGMPVPGWSMRTISRRLIETQARNHDFTHSPRRTSRGKCTVSRIPKTDERVGGVRNPDRSRLQGLRVLRERASSVSHAGITRCRGGAFTTGMVPQARHNRPWIVSVISPSIPDPAARLCLPRYGRFLRLCE